LNFIPQKFNTLSTKIEYQNALASRLKPPIQI